MIKFEYLLIGLLFLFVFVLLLIFLIWKRNNDKKPKVIWTVFAGRQRYLEILLRYIDYFISKGWVDECHLWNYTRDPKDEVWLKSEHGKHPRVKIMEVENKSVWGEYYHYYNAERFPNHVIIKCDDDILYVDPERFHSFIERRRKDQETFLLFPSIINNGVCAHLQQNAGLFPPDSFGILPYDTFCGRLWSDGKLAVKIHESFIEKVWTYKDQVKSLPRHRVKIGDRTSINFFAVLSKDLHLWSYVSPKEHFDDEHQLSVEIPSKSNRFNTIDQSFFVSHLSFYKQRQTGMDDETALIQKYSLLADSTLGKKF